VMLVMHRGHTAEATTAASQRAAHWPLSDDAQREAAEAATEAATIVALPALPLEIWVYILRKLRVWELGALKPHKFE
jgi:hypothetical protein